MIRGTYIFYGDREWTASTRISRLPRPKLRSSSQASSSTQRMGANTIEVTSGHCAMVSHPEETHERIVTAANAAAVPR
jgi:hypothetical protein